MRAMANSMAEKILILGGTAEAADLAAGLVAQGNNVTSSLAGRTREPLPLAGKVRTGGFGGAKGLAQYLRENAFDRLIDATHPFAKQISANAREAAALTGIAFEQRTRAPWPRLPEDNWICVETLEAARDAIPANARVLLALGSQHIARFATRSNVHFLVRMVDPPQAPLALPSHELVIGLPSADPIVEAELFRRFAITHLVSRNSGGTRAYAKIEAARQMKLPVIILQS